MTLTFKCAECDEVHEGVPTFGAEAPFSYYAIPENERGLRCDIGSDACVIDGKEFYVRGCLEIPVHGEKDPFVWGVWVSLSERSFKEWIKNFDKDRRSDIGPFFGWLNACLRPYPDSINLKTNVHFRDHGIRPYIELEPTEHPLAMEQREGISIPRLAEIYSIMTHEGSGSYG